MKRHAIVDVLRRAKVDVTVVGVEIASEVAVCSRGVKIVPDVKFDETTFKVVSHPTPQKSLMVKN